MRKILLLGISAVFLMAGSIASADTYKRLECDEGNGSCSFKEKLKKLQTKEFRGHCTHPQYGINDKTPSNMKCKKNTHQNTCTITADPRSMAPAKEYLSCSCTNWDVTTSHNVKIEIECITSKQN